MPKIVEVLAKKTTVWIYFCPGQISVTIKDRDTGIFCSVSKNIPIVQRQGQICKMSNFGRFWFQKWPYFLYYRPYTIFPKFSAGFAAVLSGTRHVNNTGILYPVQTATFTCIQAAVRLYVYPNHSEALFLITATFFTESFVLSFQCIFTFYYRDYTFGILLTNCFDWQVLCLSSSLLMIATIPKDSDSAFIYLSFPGFIFIYELWTISIGGNFTFLAQLTMSARAFPITLCPSSVRLSVCLSVRPSVRLLDFFQTYLRLQFWSDSFQILHRC